MPPRCRTAEKMLDPSEKVWSTLRCLEYQLEAHEARFHRDGDVNWQAIRHMIMVAQHEARTTGAALRRAWTDEDAVGDDLAQIKLQLRETEQELQRLRRVHMEFQSEELTEARATIADLRQQLDAANSAVTLQRAGIERLQAFFERVRCEAHEDPELYIPFARLVLQFNAGSIEPAPCQGCERLRAELADEEKCRQLQVAEIERLDAFVSKVRQMLFKPNSDISYGDINGLRAAIAELDAGTEPAPVAEPAPCPECERLRAFVGGIDNLLEQDRFDRRDIAELLIVLRSNSSATLTSSPAPVVEPLDPEGGA